MFRIIAHHDLRVVVVACALCIAGCLSTLRLLAHARAASGPQQGSWIAAGSLAISGSIWVTQYLALLAITPNAGLRVNALLAVLSALVALFGATMAFTCAMANTASGLAAAGGLLGATIAGMNLISSASLLNQGSPHFNVFIVVATFAVSIGLSIVAMMRLRLDRQVSVALLLSATVVVLHFALDSTLSITPDTLPPHGVPAALMAAAISAAALMVLVGSLTTLLMDKYLLRRTEAENAQLRRFAEASFEGLFVLEGAIIVEANSALCTMLSAEAADIIGRPAAAIFAPDSDDAIGMLQQGLERGTELYLLDVHGQRHLVEVLARSLTPHSPAIHAKHRVAVAVREAAPCKPVGNRKYDLAHTDPLTGLANRFLMQERLAVALADAERDSTTVAVLSLCLDQDVNDVLGAAAGDSIINEVAARLRNQVREADTIARTGAAEFVIIAPLPKGPGSAPLLAQRITRALSSPIKVYDQICTLTASLGVAIYPSGAASADTLLRQAGMARFRAKQEEPGGYRFFAAAMDTEMPERRLMIQDLRHAVENDEFALHYQPMFNAETLSVVSYEGLLRWKRPLGGFVAPGQFIPVAEACGAMLNIGLWALEAACLEAASWPRRHGISLNLSLVQLQNPDLPSQIADILARTNLPAGRLELEVSERLLIGNTVPVLSVMRALQAQGIRIALDDFGSGTASLSHLHCFPFNRVKIHRSFVIDLGIDPHAETIVTAIIGMARDAKLDVTAAGVETEQQLALLRSMRCNHLQGFLLGRPAPASSIVYRAPAHLAAA